MNVNKTTLIRGESDRCILKTEKTVFKTNYINHIPVNVSQEDFEALQNGGKTYKSAKQTPILHSIRKQAIDYLKNTNAFNK